MLVGYFILEELKTLYGDKKELGVKLDLFRKRYPEDREFQNICELFDTYTKSYEAKLFGEFEKEVERIALSRKMSSSGGGGLPFGDRRHMRDERSSR